MHSCFRDSIDRSDKRTSIDGREFTVKKKGWVEEKKLMREK